MQPLITTDLTCRARWLPGVAARRGCPATADLHKCDTQAPDVDIQALRDKFEASIREASEHTHTGHVGSGLTVWL